MCVWCEPQQDKWDPALNEILLSKIILINIEIKDLVDPKVKWKKKSCFQNRLGNKDFVWFFFLIW